MRIAVNHVKYNEAPADINPRSESFSEVKALEYVRSNLEKNYSMLKKAGEQGADLAVTNEDFGDIGRFPKNKTFPELFPGIVKKLESEISETVRSIAKQYKMNIAYNEYQTENGKIYNASVFVDRSGSPIGRQNKVHLAMNERFKSAYGDLPVIIKTDLGVVGFCICYDLLFPEYCRSLGLLGADIIIHQSQGWGFGGAPARQAGEAIVRTRAFENSAYLIVAKNIQNEGGMSCILDNFGDILATAPGLAEQVLIADITPEFKMNDKYDLGNYFAGVESSRVRKLLGRRPETYGILTDPNPPALGDFPGARLCTEDELAARSGALADLDKNNPAERRKYHWHPKL